MECECNSIVPFILGFLTWIAFQSQLLQLGLQSVLPANWYVALTFAYSISKVVAKLAYLRVLSYFRRADIPQGPMRKPRVVEFPPVESPESPENSPVREPAESQYSE